MLVRPNLYAFLKQARKHISEQDNSSCGPWIFIDALCINQNNTDEKSSQVALMGDVYRGASEVIAWLGDRLHKDHYGGPIGTSFAEDMRDFLDRARMIEKPCVSSVTGPDEVTRAVEEKAFWIALPVVDQDYWERVWIVQELVLAKTLTFWLMTFRVPWEWLYECLQLLSPPEYAAGELRSEWEKANVVHQLEDTWHQAKHQRASAVLRARTRVADLASGDRMDMSDAIVTTTGRDCRRSVDGVYGILGMTRSVLHPDYTRPLLSVYASALIEGLLETMQRTGHRVSKDIEHNVAAMDSASFTIRLALSLRLDLVLWAVRKFGLIRPFPRLDQVTVLVSSYFATSKVVLHEVLYGKPSPALLAELEGLKDEIMRKRKFSYTDSHQIDSRTQRDHLKALQ
ncbi:hypothetical protein LTR15_004234 [Elasticomyces elasticus]|nr:hypothetical protein LTR15_004234 [Elasticomyces elasticus]